jgi:adhesin/invasin
LAPHTTQRSNIMTMKTMFRLATGCIVSAALLLAGCGGGSGSGSTAAKVTGYASEGALIMNQPVDLKDAAGTLKPGVTTTDNNGFYSIDVTGLTAPFIVRIKSNDGTKDYVSIAKGINEAANINPATTMVLALTAGSADPKALFDNLTKDQVTAIKTGIDVKTTAFNTTMSALYVKTGLQTSATAVAPDFFKTPVTQGAGIDALFDTVKMEVTSTGLNVETKATATNIVNVAFTGGAFAALPTTITVPETVIPVQIDSKAATLTITAVPIATLADGTSIITLTADVKTKAGTSVPDNMLVSFAVTAGTATLNVNEYRTFDGKATATAVSSKIGTVTVAATVKGSTITGSTSINFTDDPNKIATLSLTAAPTTIAADGKAATTLTADVKTAGGAAAPDGTAVAFTTTTGTLSAASATTTNGKASVTLTATTAGTATITAAVGTIQNTTAVTINTYVDPNAIKTVVLTADKSTAITGQSITLTADVKTNSGAAAPDNTTVTFTTTGGTLSASTATTVSGKASVTITSSTAATPSVAASVTIISSTVGGAATISGPVSLTFTTPIVYTQAILKLKTVGTLASGKLVGGWQVTVKMPATGISIKTKSTTNMALDTTTAFLKSGVTPASFTFTGSYNKPDSTSTVPYVMVSNAGDVSDPLVGTAIGEVATLTFDIAAGTATPAKADFVLTGASIAEAAVGVPALAGVSMDFDISYK